MSLLGFTSSFDVRAFCLNKWMPVIIGAWCVLAMGESVVAQELLHSRAPLPGLSDTSQVGISIDIGSTQQLIHPAFIMEILQPRLEKIGYRVARASTHSLDGLWLQVDCETIPVRKGLPPRDRAGSALRKPPRLGPPCQFAYSYHREVVPWKNVERLIYSESVAAMQQISQAAVPLNPQECVKEFFRLYDFPMLLAAEWGHVDRLLQVLHHPDTGVSRQKLILMLFGEAHIARGYPVLVEKLQDRRVAKEAAEAIGFFGLRAQKHLLPLLQDRSDPQLQAAAAKGLGRIAAATGNSQQTPLYMNMVADTTLDLRVRTQLAWILGKAPDMRSFPTLLGIEKYVWNDPSHDPDLQAFREAIDWSIREVKQGGHGDDY